MVKAFGVVVAFRKASVGHKKLRPTITVYTYVYVHSHPCSPAENVWWLDVKFLSQTLSYGMTNETVVHIIEVKPFKL